jgi:hypothetical protein
MSKTVPLNTPASAVLSWRRQLQPSPATGRHVNINSSINKDGLRKMCETLEIDDFGNTRCQEEE